MAAIRFDQHVHGPGSARLSALALGAALCTQTPAFALDADRSLAQLHHTAWTAEDGAPSQISAITQTADGYLWIGSARGLFRFDGVEFERYGAPDGASLPSHNTYSLLATREGDVWISFRPSGLGHVKNGKLTTFVRPDEIPPSHVYVLVQDLDGQLFTGTHDGLFVREGSRWLPIGSKWNLPPERVQALFVDRDGTLWIASGGQVRSLARGSRMFVPQHDVAWVAKLSQGLDRWIWMTLSDRVTAIPYPRSVRAPVVNQPSTDVLVDRDGCLWIATPFEGLQRVPSPDVLGAESIWPGDPRIESMREARGLSDDAVHVLFEDREGNIWAGTAKGIDRFRHNHFVPVTLPDGYQAFTLLPAEDGAMWVGSAKGKALLHVSARETTAIDFDMAVASVYRDEDGVIWWGSANRVVRQERGSFRWFPLFPTRDMEWSWEVIRSDQKGALWVNVGDMGLHHFRDGVWEERKPPEGLPDRGPSASYHAPDGRIWLGYTENRVCVLDGLSVRAYGEADGIGIGRVRVIRGRGPHIWVGGELGLALFDHGRFRTIACAGTEPFGTVAGIVETEDGSLWLNEMQGVVHIAADEIARVVHDPAHIVDFRRYDVQEGLPGSGQMNWNVSTATQATDGKLWFATDGGLAWIDPGRVTTNVLPPPVLVRSITTEDGSFNPDDAIRLRNDTETLRIDYTALSLSIPERVRFRYRLVGYDEQWVEAETRRTAFYTRLRPGSYRFQVVASNNDGVWNWTGAMASFSIAPAFYQTGWFAAAVLLAVLCSLWLLYRLRVRQVASRLERLHDERMDERMRIAHELHDTLLQGFLSASMQLHVAREAIPGDSSARNQVARVLGLMDLVIADARNAVRGLRAPELAELEQSFARIPVETGANGADVRVVMEGRPRPLLPTARDEVYRIGRESILNALRHAGAQTIETEISYLPRELRLVVRDDGRGMDEAVLRGGRDGHWGLSGMRERAKRMGGEFTVRSRPGSGTEIELVVPARIAYANGSPENDFFRVMWWPRRRSTPPRKEE